MINPEEFLATLPDRYTHPQARIDALEAEIERLKKIETKYNTVVGAMSRGNITQARIWCGLSGDGAT